ncbi:DUF6507 family protein [Cellulomonas sp. P5_C6]
MSRWHIEPAGVQDVLTRVGSAAELLGSAVEQLPGHAESVVAGTASSPIIADALSGFFEFYKPTLTSIGNRINASVGGAAAATRWYLTGDEEMAAQQQAAAQSVAGTGVSTFTVPPVPGS